MTTNDRPDAPDEGGMNAAEEAKARRIAEAGQRRSEERHAAATIAGRIGVFDHDHADGTVYWSPVYRDLIGYPADLPASLGRLLELVHPEDRARMHATIARSYDPEGDGVLDVEHRIVLPDGAIRWLRARAQTVFDGDWQPRRPLRTIGTAVDITDRRSAVEQAVRSKERLEIQVSERTRQLEAMLDAAVNAILTIDADGAIKSVNAATVRLLGWEREELVGRNVNLLMPEPYRREHDRYIRSYLDTGNRKIIGIGREVTARHKSGRTFPVHLSVSEYEAGGVRYFTGIITDLTERKAAEAALRDKERQLAQAQKMEAVGQLTGGIAHDFNNLLTIITGNLELLDMTLDDERARDLVRRADEAARMGARLTGRLLTFSRKRNLNPTVLDLNETAIGMSDLLRHSLGEAITVTTDLAPGLWPTRADASEVENAILNLAINARDAMPGGGRLLIETRNVELSGGDLDVPDIPPGDYVLLSVSDNGCGMPTEVVARAFEPFFTTKEPGKGTGLGLSTIYGFVRQSGGRATIYSEPGKGTVVNLYLPRHVAVDGAAAAPSGRPVPVAAMHERVLVVEDNDQVRELAVRRLEALGYTVEAADSGPAAVARLEADAGFDLVFSDIVMPGGMSGFDLVRWVRTSRPHVKVLLASGFAPHLTEAGDPDSGLGGVRVLRKPYAQADLARTMREVLAS